MKMKMNVLCLALLALVPLTGCSDEARESDEVASTDERLFIDQVLQAGEAEREMQVLARGLGAPIWWDVAAASSSIVVSESAKDAVLSGAMDAGLPLRSRLRLIAIVAVLSKSGEDSLGARLPPLIEGRSELSWDWAHGALLVSSACTCAELEILVDALVAAGTPRRKIHDSVSSALKRVGVNWRLTEGRSGLRIEVARWLSNDLQEGALWFLGVLGQKGAEARARVGVPIGSKVPYDDLLSALEVLDGTELCGISFVANGRAWGQVR